MKIDSLAPTLLKGSLQNVQNTGQNTLSFGEMLKEALNKTNDLCLQADEAAVKFAAGQIENVHEAMIIAEKASIALEMTVQIRNKLLDAYNEIMRMQV